MTQQLPEVNPAPLIEHPHPDPIRTGFGEAVRDAFRWTERDVRLWASWVAIGSLVEVVVMLVLSAAGGQAPVEPTVVPGPTVVVTVTAPPAAGPDTADQPTPRTADAPRRPRVVPSTTRAPETAPSATLTAEPTPAGTSGPPEPTEPVSAPNTTGSVTETPAADPPPSPDPGEPPDQDPPTAR